jgi:hypothetical protein
MEINVSYKIPQKCYYNVYSVLRQNSHSLIVLLLLNMTVLIKIWLHFLLQGQRIKNLAWTLSNLVFCSSLLLGVEPRTLGIPQSQGWTVR